MKFIKCKVFLLFVLLFNFFSSCHYVDLEEINLDEIKYEEEKNLWNQKNIKDYSYIYEHQKGSVPHYESYFIEVKGGNYKVSKLEERYYRYEKYCILCKKDNINPKTVIEFCYNEYCKKCNEKNEDSVSYDEYVTKINVSNKENIKNMNELYTYIYDDSQGKGGKVRISVEYDEEKNIPTYFEKQVVASNLHEYVTDERIFVYDFKVTE